MTADPSRDPHGLAEIFQKNRARGIQCLQVRDALPGVDRHLPGSIQALGRRRDDLASPVGRERESRRVGKLRKPLALPPREVGDEHVLAEMKLRLVEDPPSAGTAATVVVVPSPHESLSLLALEAMAVGTPVLVNARSEVLVEHCRRSNAGLWYADRWEFTEALRLRPDFALAANNLGFVYYKQGRHPEAARWFENAIRMDPSRAIAYCNLGDAYLKAGDKARARKAFETYLELAPKGPSAEHARQALASLQ